MLHHHRNVQEETEKEEEEAEEEAEEEEVEEEGEAEEEEVEEELRGSLSIGNPFSFVIRSRQTLRYRPNADRRISLKRCYKTVAPRWCHRRRESSGCTRDGNLSMMR